MSERVTPRTVWAAMREMFSSDALLQAARVNALVMLIGGGSYLIILCVLFFSTGAWHFGPAVLGMVFWAVGMAVICGVVNLVEWVRWR